MKKLAILGAGSHGKMVADSALLSGWSELSFFDDSISGKLEFTSWHIKGDRDNLIKSKSDFDGVIIAIGDNKLRVELIKKFIKLNLPIVTIRHPKSVVSPYAELGIGTVLLAGSIISPFCKLGLGCILNTSATVDHESKLSEGVHVSAGAHLGGLVSVGSFTFFGLGSSTISGIKIGSNVIVGGGAVVTKNVDNDLTVVGVPAKPIVKS